MLRDLEKGRKTEVDTINGVVCEYGIKANIKTPINDKIVEIVKLIENNELKPKWNNIELFNN